jgi:hypothetical protein
MISTSITNNDDINQALLNIGKKSKNPTIKEAAVKYTKTNTTKAPGKQTKTHTDNLTKEQIKDLLEDYNQVKNINDVAIGTHLRYFSKVGNENKFRMGGNLKLIEKEYVILKNAVNVEWSVQMNDTTFFKKMTNKDIKQEYDNIIEDLHEKIKKLKSENKLLKSENTELKANGPKTIKTTKTAKTTKTTKK